MNTKVLLGIVGQYGLAYYFFGWKGVLVWLLANFAFYGASK